MMRLMKKTQKEISKNFLSELQILMLQNFPIENLLYFIHMFIF